MTLSPCWRRRSSRRWPLWRCRIGRRRVRNAATWALRVVISAIFVYEGLDKFSERRLWIRVFTEIGFGQWFRYFTGIVECAGAGLLLVPRTSVLGAALLTCTMVGALRSEERRVGKECRSGWSRDD